MPANPDVEAHFAMLRSLSGATATPGGGDAPVPPRADNMSSSAEPVAGAQGAAELVQALDKGLAQGDSRGR